MKEALGRKGYLIALVFLGLAHFQLAISSISFTAKSLQSTNEAWHSNKFKTPLWVFGICIIIVFSPVAWARRLSNF